MRFVGIAAGLLLFWSCVSSDVAPVQSDQLLRTHTYQRSFSAYVPQDSIRVFAREALGINEFDVEDLGPQSIRGSAPERDWSVVVETESVPPLTHVRLRAVDALEAEEEAERAVRMIEAHIHDRISAGRRYMPDPGF